MNVVLSVTFCFTVITEPTDSFFLPVLEQSRFGKHAVQDQSMVLRALLFHQDSLPQE